MLIKNNDILYKNKIENADNTYINIINNLGYNDELKNLEYIKRLNEIIYNTYNNYRDNYYNSININKILMHYHNSNIYNNDLLDNEYSNIKKINKNEEEEYDNINENDEESENEENEEEIHEENNQNEIFKELDDIHLNLKNKIINKIDIYEFGEYDGELINDKREGKGIILFKDGTKYEGEFINNKKEGKGIYYFNDGTRYEGEFKNDILEGKGVYYFNNDEDRYEAKFIKEEITKNEEKYLDNPQYMSKQEDINEKMRAILIDWLIDVQIKYKLSPKTIYITVILIDIYLSKTQVYRTNFQLVGITAMYIACKYQEIYYLIMENFVYITDKAYVKSDMQKMLSQMLKTLNFDMNFPTQWDFLVSYKRKLDLDEKTFNLAWFLMELCLIDYEILGFKMSHIAASAIIIAATNTGVYRNNWIKDNIGIDEEDLDLCRKEIYEFYNNNLESNLKAIKRKFSSSKYLEVAKIELS